MLGGVYTYIHTYIHTGLSFLLLDILSIGRPGEELCEFVIVIVMGWDESHVRLLEMEKFPFHYI